MSRGKYARRRQARARQLRQSVTGLPAQMPADTPQRPLATPPFRAPDIKDDGGWQILDAHGLVAGYATSRDRARARARELNAA